MGRNERNVTIQDIAVQAGVSISTVHLVLAGKRGPKEQTRERVLKIAREMNYQCNSAASSLSRGVTRMAAILPSPEEQTMFCLHCISWTLSVQLIIF